MKTAAPIAYIFDFDGVLVNTMDAHFECYRRALAEVGVPIDRARFYYQAGMTGREQINYFASSAGKKVNADQVYDRKRELWNDHRHRVSCIECNLKLLNALRTSGIPVAIATGSSEKTVRPIMRQFGIEVDAVVTADDVTRGKPHPDLFLAAADKLGVSPHDCIVIEDAEVGIEAARAAGMRAMRFLDNSGLPE